MDMVRARRMASDVVSLNAFALERVRDAVNADPASASARYGLSILTAQRIGRLSHGALLQFGDVAMPLLRVSHVGLADVLDRAGRCSTLAPGLRDTFVGGSDPELARMCLALVREDARRSASCAAARWSWPQRCIDRLIDLPVSAIALASEAAELRFEDTAMVQSYLSHIEANPLAHAPAMVRLGAVSSMGALPGELVAA